MRPTDHLPPLNDFNHTETALEFVSQYCKGRIKAKFPASMWPKTVEDIQQNKSLDDDYKRAWKLISRKEYRKDSKN
jgi:hypothetical protein